MPRSPAGGFHDLKRMPRRHVLKIKPGGPMKTCRRCGEDFEESSGDYSPAQELGEMFLDSMGTSGVDDLCPKCMEDLGVANLLGFGE